MKSTCFSARLYKILNKILQDLHKIGCTSAIQASLIAFGLHYLSARSGHSNIKSMPQAYAKIISARSAINFEIYFA